MGRKCCTYLLISLVVLASNASTSEEQDQSKHGHDSGHEDHWDFDFSDFFGEENMEDDGHLEQHLKEDIGMEKSVENMTETEKDWYYFKLHDTNEDMALDGLEILKAWQHHYLDHMGHDGMGHNDNGTAEHNKFIAEQNNMFIDMVDNILKEMDLNDDGTLDYLEYALAKLKSKDDSSQGENKDDKNKEEKKK